jgi:hypothetical protein
MRQKAEIIGKLRRDQRPGVRDQINNDLAWDGRLDLGGWGLDIEKGSEGAREQVTEGPREHWSKEGGSARKKKAARTV